jgi:hypothetical protein
MQSSDPSGQQRVLWWIIGALLGPIVLAVFGNLVNTTLATSERTGALQAQYHEIDQRMARIERKLDQLLERK